MIKSFVTQSDLLQLEPILSEYIPDGQIDYNSQITQAELRVISDIKNKGFNIKTLCTPLVLQEETSLTTETESVEDDIERLVWVVDVLATTQTVKFTLMGSNDDETFEEIGELNFGESSVQHIIIVDPRNHYKIIPTTSGTITYKSSLIEFSFYHAVLYMSLSIAYQLLIASPDDRYAAKSDYFLNLYINLINNMKISVDSDTDGVIDSINNASDVRLMR